MEEKFLKNSVRPQSSRVQALLNEILSQDLRDLIQITLPYICAKMEPGRNAHSTSTFHILIIVFSLRKTLTQFERLLSWKIILRQYSGSFFNSDTSCISPVSNFLIKINSYSSWFAFRTHKIYKDIIDSKNDICVHKASAALLSSTDIQFLSEY